MIKPIACALLLASALTGCATPPRPTPLAQTDIISMTKAGLTDGEIIHRIDATSSVFKLNADDVVLLRKEGVSDRVVTYMLDTYTRAALAKQRQNQYDEYQWTWRFGLGTGVQWTR